MKNKIIFVLSHVVFSGMCVLGLFASLGAALQPNESLHFGPGSGHEPTTNGNLEGQAVGFITIHGARHHALFTAVGQSATFGMDLLVFDVDTQQLVYTFNIKDTAGAYDLWFHENDLYFTTITRPFLYRYDTTRPSVPPERVVEIPSHATGSDAWNGYAFGTIVGPDKDQALAIKEGVVVSSSEYKAIYLSATYTGHLYRYTQTSGLEDLGQIKSEEVYGRFPQTWKNYLIMGTGAYNPSAVVYDIATENFHSLLPPDLAGGPNRLQARIYKKLYPDNLIEKGPDIIYVGFDELNRVIYSLDLSKWKRGEPPSSYWKRHEFPTSSPPRGVTGISFSESELPLESAMVYRSPDTTKDSLMINSLSGLSIESLGYHGGSVIFAATANMGDDFYFSSYLPGYLFRGNLATGIFSDRFPYVIGGESYSLLAHTLSGGKRMLYSGNYAGGFALGVTDLADTSKITKMSFQLPSGENIAAHWRPRAMVRDSKGMIFIGAQPGYGLSNGYIVRFNPESTIRCVGSPYYSNYYADYHTMETPHQSVTALFPSDPYLVAGTMNTVGVGAPVVAESAQLFLYCGQDAGACAGRRDTLINAIDLKNLTNRDNPAQKLKVTKVFSVAGLGDGEFTASVQYESSSGYLSFSIDSSDASNPTLAVHEAAVLPAHAVDGKGEYWTPSSFVAVEGSLYAISTSRVYLVERAFGSLAYTPIFNTSYHRVDIGGVFRNNSFLYYSSEDNVFRWGPIPTGPFMSSPSVTARTYATLQLSWPIASDIVGTVRYDVERRQRKTASYEFVGSTRVTTFKDMGLTPGTRYEYRVRAVDEGALQTPLGVFNTRSVYSPTVVGETIDLPAFTDNFDSETTGGSPSRWDIHSDVGTSILIDETTPHGRGGKAVCLLDSSTSTYAQIQHFSGAPLDTVYYKASVRFKEKNQLSYVFHGNGDKTSLWFLMAYNGRWSYSNGAATFRFPNDTEGFEAGRWYDVEVEADFSKGTYGAWVNGRSIGQGIPIFGDNTSLTGFRILPAGTPGQGGLWVDDLYFAAKRPDQDLLAPRLMNVQAINATDHSLTIAWETDEAADTFVKWGLTSALENDPSSATAGETAHSCHLSGLASGAKYYFQVQSKDAQGNNAHSDVLSAETLAVPPAVSLVSPHYNSTFTTPQTVTITASAQGAPVKMEFYDGATLKQTVFGPPFAMNWLVNALDNGAHSWTARAVGEGGHGETSSTVNLVVAIDTQAPSAPSRFIAEEKNHALDLNWVSSSDEGGSGMSGYRMDVSVDEGFASFVPGWHDRFLGPVTSTSVPGLSDATVYFSRLRAVDQAGNFSPNSFVVRARTLDTTAPVLSLTNPSGDMTCVTPQTLTISAAAADNMEVSKVWFLRNRVVLSTDVAEPYEHPWTVADTDNGTYTWMATAFDAAGNSAQSDPVVVTVNMDDQNPSAPTGLTATGGVKFIDLSWIASTDAGGSGLSGYALDVSTESSFSSFLPGWENKFLGLVVSARVAGLESDTLCYARLRAQDNRGNLSENSLSVSTRTSVLKGEFPLTEGWLWARGSLSKSGDTWTYAESTDNGGHYVYKRTTSGLSSSGTLRFSVMAKATASPARDVDLIMYNTDATSNRATAQCALSGAGAVTSVTGGEAKAVIGSINALEEGWYLCSVSAKLDGRSGSNLTFIVWGKSEGTGSYDGDPAAGFQFKNPLVVILPEDTEPPTVAIATPTAGTTFTAPRTVPVKATASDNGGVAKVWFLRNGVVVSTDTAAPFEFSWPVTAADNGAHSWTTRAFDVMGNSSISALIPVTVEIDITPPSAPGTLTASEISSTTLRLSWSSATDNAGVAGYHVHRGTATIATVAGSVTSFVDSGLTSNTVYRYTVTAFDAAGYVSPLSNELSVSTRRLPLISPLGSVHHTTNRSVELGWEAVAGATRYTLAAGRSKTTESFDVQGESTEGKGSLSGLTANTTYYVYLKACDEEGCSPYSFVDAVVTLAIVPLLSNAERKGNEIELTIDAQGNPAGTRYRVEMRKGTGEFSPHSEATSLSRIISGLNSGEIYHFRVMALNHQGLMTIPSNDLDVTLPPDTLDSVRAYPVPYRSGLGAEGITFDRLPEETIIRLFTIDGRPVKTLTTNTEGKVLWALDNGEGSPVASGVYMAMIEKGGARKKLKLVVQK